MTWTCKVAGTVVYMARTKEIIGYRVMCTFNDSFVHTEANGFNFMHPGFPPPIPRGDAFRRLAGMLGQRPDLDADDFTVEPVYRELSPL